MNCISTIISTLQVHDMNMHLMHIVKHITKLDCVRLILDLILVSFSHNLLLQEDSVSLCKRCADTYNICTETVSLLYYIFRKMSNLNKPVSV